MSTTLVFVILFASISLQALISMLQVKNYRSNLKEINGNGIVGVGHTKGYIRSGQIILLKYNQDLDRVIDCRIMEGLTVLARFKRIDDYNGLTLAEIRNIALDLDQKAFKRRRKRHPYNAKEITKKKHALIQAVEAIERRIESSKKVIKVSYKKDRQLV